MTRFFLYSHDTYGLGHLRRSTLLAEAIVKGHPSNEVLIATGSPLAQAFSLPERVDALKLPSATKDGAGAYQPRKLAGSMRRLVAVRSAVVMAAMTTWDPDVVVVDHAPLGMAGELLPVLEHYADSECRPRLVLGLRDIIDEAERVEVEWRESGVWRWLDTYDDIFVYGDRRLLTTATELGIESPTSPTVTHTGYVAPSKPERLPDVEPFLLVTPGGGGDGQALLRSYLDAVEAGATSGVRSLVVTGPLMSSARRDELASWGRRLPSVEIVEFVDSMRTLIASAQGVISMAGYNTVVEELVADVPALLVPRCEPRLEQDIRARRLAPHSRLRYCPKAQLDTDTIARFVTEVGCAPGSAGGCGIDLDGAATAARLLQEHRQIRPAPSFAHRLERFHDAPAAPRPVAV